MLSYFFSYIFDLLPKTGQKQGKKGVKKTQFRCRKNEICTNDTQVSPEVSLIDFGLQKNHLSELDQEM